MAIGIRYILACILMATVVTAANGQTVAQDINAIKRDTTYVYAEDTNKDRGEAISCARTKLEMNVGEWVRGAYPSENIDLCVARVKEHCSLKETTRGNLIRAFVYVKKSDIVPLSLGSDIMVVKVPQKQPEVKPNNPDVVIVTKEAPKLTPEEKKMADMSAFSEIEPFVRELKSQGRLKAYGKYATLPAEGDCYILVYNKEGGVAAALKRTGDHQVNLTSKQEDNVRNYKNCGAIWLQMKP